MGSGGLSETDIEKMVKDAEANAEADSKRRETIDKKNELDSLIYSTEKTLSDNAEKVDEELKKEVESAIAAAKEVKDKDDLDVLKAKTDELNKAAMKVGQAIYQQKKPGDDDDDDATVSDDKKKQEDSSSSR